jgi:hypothetical protein
MPTPRSLATLALLCAAAAALPAAAGAAPASDPPPGLAAKPAVSFQVVVDDKGHFVSLGGVVRLRHKLTDHQRRTFALVAGARLRTGQAVPDELFGGTSLGRIGSAGRNCYAAEVGQLRRHAGVHSGAIWRVGFTDGTRVVGTVRAARLVRGASSDRAAAQRLGCFS